MKIVISGASGQVGRLAAQQLLGQQSPSDVVLVSRSPDALSEFAAIGAEVRYGDFDRPDSLDGAFAGADRLLMISTNEIGRRLDQHHAKRKDAGNH